MFKTLKKIWYELSAKERSYLKAGLSIIGFVGFFSIFLLPLILTRKFWSFVDYNSTSGIGDTINGISSPFIALLAALLTFLAFYIQYKANIQQRNQFRIELRQRGQDSKAQDKIWQIERLENRFFEMIKFHRQNVGEMNYTSYSRTLAQNPSDDKLEKHRAVGKKVFKEVFSDFEKLFDEVNILFENASENQIYKEQYLQNLRKNVLLSQRNIDLILYAKIDIVYCIIFFGTGESGIATIKNFFAVKYNSNFYDDLLLFASLKPKVESKNWRKWLTFIKLSESNQQEIFKQWRDDRINELNGIETHKSDENKSFQYRQVYYNNNYYKYYGGHQFRLGHYFRHLFQTVTYINESRLLSYCDKYANIKLLRGQLSTYEQLIIFINSVSSLGRVWELETKKDPSKAFEINEQLITKYNLIKNVPGDFIVKTVYSSDFYPDVIYEALPHNNEEQRQMIEKLYY
ncbi:MAG TPA: putative phage abortive infection protein [Flavisolibacter sp.]|nr:putative phage abortive infection protein [Flavisolibacter sp.]